MGLEVKNDRPEIRKPGRGKLGEDSGVGLGSSNALRRRTLVKNSQYTLTEKFMKICKE